MEFISNETHDPRFTPLADFIKSMERKYLTITQDLKMSRAMEIISKRKWQTLENIVHKTNIKLGGVNYELCPVSEEYDFPNP